MFEQQKHISFDVWKTLVTPSKEYSKLRDECISDHLKITPENAKALYGNVKRFLDKSAEIGNICMSTPNCWSLLEAMAKIKGTDLVALQSDVHDAFRKNLPTIYDEIIVSLQALKEDGYSIGIISNTNFVPGSVLRSSIFNEWNVFNDMLFSDEELIPKPNSEIFERMYANVKTIIGEDTKRSEIIHVGDNKICDGISFSLGFNFLYVKDPLDLALKLNHKEAA